MKELKQNCIKYLLLAVCIPMLLSCVDKARLESEHETLLDKYQADQTLENAIALGEFYNFKYFKAGQEEIKFGLDQLEQIRQKYTDSNMILILTGNLYTRYAETYYNQLDQDNAFVFVEKGFEMIDDSIKNEPDNPRLLFFRAINSSIVPDFLNRVETGLADAEKLYNNRSSLPNEDYIPLAMFYYSDLLDKSGNKEKAMEIINELKEQYPDYKKTITELENNNYRIMK